MIWRDRDNLRRLIRESKLARLEDYLMQFARPSIRIYTERVADESELAIGESKIGGRPDLPSELQWATYFDYDMDISLPFIAQIRLEHITACDEERLLPEKGMLYFFSGPRYQSQRDGHAGKVLFYDGDMMRLARRDFPEDMVPVDLPPAPGGDRYEPCRLTFVPEVNLDHTGGWEFVPEVRSLLPDDYVLQDLLTLRRQTDYILERGWTLNRMLGTEKADQARLDCQIKYQFGKQSRLTDEEYAQAEQHLDEWQLLLQVDSDPNADMMWHDAGSIFFFIRKEDLKARRFDKVYWTFETG